MTSYIFIFGRTPDMSWEEIRALYPQAKRLASGVALLDVADSVQASQMMHEIGGTIKIARVLDTSGQLNAGQLYPLLAPQTGKLIFGISVYDPSVTYPNALPEAIKTLAKHDGLHVRYLRPEHGMSLSSVTVSKNRAQELIVVRDAQQLIIGGTEAVQPFETWRRMDYGRPYADPKLGMLPPKVARMAVNIALGSDRIGKTVLDPFCGMGTILIEAYRAGCNVWGSDISAEAVRKSRQNLKWVAGLPSEMHQRQAVRIEQADATHSDEIFPQSSADAVVTEPFLGTPKLGEHKIASAKVRDIIKGLEKLYIGSLKSWRSVLKINGTVCIAVPSISAGGHEYVVKKPIDTCEKLGYTKVLGPITYAREQAVVRRDFYLLKKVV